tara:strand:+ start:163 stop:450 length:288 start_codon:yes stop_codon:yes gene_type:complete
MKRYSNISQNKMKNKYQLSKPVKYGIIFVIGIMLTPGVILNIPPVDVEEQIKNDDGSMKTVSSDGWFFTGRSSILSSIVHLVLFLFIIFVIDYFF